jgi:C1A family cysteine protease
MKTIAIISVIAAIGLLYLANNQGFSLSANAQFEEFISTYGKNYASEPELNFRREVFSANMKNAERLNAENPLAEFGMTVFSDLTESEMIKRMGAIAPSTPSDAPVHTQESVAAAAIDWRKDLQPVQNQGSCGSCWAFSATAAFEGRYKLSQGPNGSSIKLSEQEALDCSSTSYGCNGGWYEAVWQMTTTDKFCTLSSYPYKAVKGSCSKKTCDGKANDKGYKLVAKTEDAMYDALKTGPISIAVDASTWSSYKSGVVTSCSTGMNHAVVLAGYDAANNAWIVRNSWGTGWGEQGYIRLAHGKNTCNLTYKPAYPTF